MKRVKKILKKTELTHREAKLLRAMTSDLEDAIYNIEIRLKINLNSEREEVLKSHQIFEDNVRRIEYTLAEAANKFYPSPREFYDVVTAARILLDERKKKS